MQSHSPSHQTPESPQSAHVMQSTENVDWYALAAFEVVLTVYI